MGGNIGFSTGCFYGLGYSLEKCISEIFKTGIKCIELNIATPHELSVVDDKHLKLLNEFTYIGIHAPFKDVIYDISSLVLIEDLLLLAKKTDARYILLHPETIGDLELIHKKLGPLAAFENMDIRKQFGNNPQDLEEIFRVCPKSKWVCDLLHVYSIDKKMYLSSIMHEMFANRLVAYHISSYGDAATDHALFYQSKKPEILSAIENDKVPLIDEGVNIEDPNFLKKEYSYLQDYFRV